MSYHLHHSAYGSRGCDHSSCLDDDDDVQHNYFEWPSERRAREAEEAEAAKRRVLPPFVPLASIDPPKRRETPSFGDVMSSLGTMIVGGVLLLLAMGIPGYLLFSVIFGGGCSMQGGTC
jgi:hypothetical protein